jgi:hypothetical protein
VTAGEALVAAAVTVGKIGEQTDRLDAEQAWRAGAHTVNLLARFGSVAEDAGSKALMI